MQPMQYRGVKYSMAVKTVLEQRQLFYSRTTFHQRSERARKTIQLVYRGTPYQLLRA